jgi:PHD/YefM family antitoxin component YafN of YafNO toxin-antitoxin module
VNILLCNLIKSGADLESVKFKDLTPSPLIITQHGEAKAVIQDISEYERIQEAMALLKMVAQGQKDYEEGKTIPADQMLNELEDRIAKDFNK